MSKVFERNYKIEDSFDKQIGIKENKIIILNNIIQSKESERTENSNQSSEMSSANGQVIIDLDSISEVQNGNTSKTNSNDSKQLVRSKKKLFGN